VASERTRTGSTGEARGRKTSDRTVVPEYGTTPEYALDWSRSPDGSSRIAVLPPVSGSCSLRCSRSQVRCFRNSFLTGLSGGVRGGSHPRWLATGGHTAATRGAGSPLDSLASQRGGDPAIGSDVTQGAEVTALPHETAARSSPFGHAAPLASSADSPALWRSAHPVRTPAGRRSQEGVNGSIGG
jgi:hypothetical protein